MTTAGAHPGPSNRNGPIYRPLDFAQFETRFLRILDLPRAPSGIRIRSELVYQHLRAPPCYTALSYAWGDATQTRYIEVDGILVAVTLSLEIALYRLRTKGELLLWVDAICINQSDNYEKSQQILRMGQIYARASKVVAWLGPAADDSDLAMEFLQALPSEENGFAFLLPEEAVDRQRNETSATLEAVRALYNRPYFKRIWIIQETAKANAVQLWCGTREAPLEAVDRSLPVIKDYVQRDLQLLAALGEFRLRERQSRIGVPRMLLALALIASRRSQSTEPRDKIYALLGLTLDGSEVVPIPNYVEELETVFTKLTGNIIAMEGLGSIMLLSSRQGADRIHLSLPSWVPSWDHLPNDLPPWILKGTQRERETLEFTSSTQNGVLTMKGVFLESISGVAQMDGCDCSLESRASERQMSRRRFESVATVTGPGIVTALCKVLMSLLDDDAAKTLSGSSIEDKRQSLLGYWKTYDAAYCLDQRHGLRFVKHLRLGGNRIRTWLTTLWPTTIQTRRTARESLVPIFASSVGGIGSILGLKSYSDRIIDSKFDRINRNIYTIREAVRLMDAHGLRLAASERGRFRLVYEQSRARDGIYRLQNCSLPVVLRECADGTYSFVGEAFERDVLEESAWAGETGWLDSDFADSRWEEVDIV